MTQANQLDRGGASRSAAAARRGEAGGERVRQCTSPYSRHVPLILAAATLLSMAHSLHVALTLDPAYGREPVLYILYLTLWGLVALARTDRRAAWLAISGTLAALIAIGIFYYPTLFVAAWQTPFGWFENDLYMGLLILAEYLAIQRLRGVTIALRA